MKAFRQASDTLDIFLNPDSDHMEIAIADNKNAYAYIIGDAIRTVKGELQLDIEAGIPYFATVFDRSDKLSIWKHYVEKKILSYDFVLGITKFDVVLIDDNSSLRYDMTIKTKDGIVDIAAVDPIGRGGGGGGGTEMLIQNGIFYLPVFLRNGIQVYRQLKEYNIEGSYTTELSDQTYIKNNEGIFVQEEV